MCVLEEAALESEPPAAETAPTSLTSRARNEQYKCAIWSAPHRRAVPHHTTFPCGDHRTTSIGMNNTDT